ncbi:Bug family tripartite tricarboxylate transporter substrate binding protein [Cupriavidus basilensis]
MNPLNRRRSAACAVALLWSCVSGTAMAAYPDHVVKIVVPLPAGTAPDLTARLLAEKLAASLKQAVIVENAPGGSTAIGAARVAKANADGYTLLVTTNQHLMLRRMVPGLSFDPARDFVPITALGTAALTLAVSTGSPYGSYRALIDAAARAPNSLTYGTPGLGSPAHLACDAILQAAGVTARHIPYKGSTEAISAAVAGTVDFTCPATSNVLPLVQGGRMRVLATTGDARNPQLVEVPTLRELNPKAPSVRGWTILLAPTGTPRDRLAVLHRAVIDAIGSPEFHSLVERGGSTALPQDMVDAARFYAAEAALATRLAPAP